MNIFWIFIFALYTNVFVVYDSIRKFTIITIINLLYLYHDNELIITIIFLSKLSHSPSNHQTSGQLWNLTDQTNLLYIINGEVNEFTIGKQMSSPYHKQCYNRSHCIISTADGASITVLMLESTSSIK